MQAHSIFTDAIDKFRRLTQREQLLVVGVVVAALYFMFDAFVFSSQKAREQVLVEQQRASQTQVLLLSTQIAAVERTQAEEVDQKTRELEQLKTQAKLLDQMVSSVSDQLPPMKELLASIVDAKTSAHVEMVSVKTIPVKSVQGLAAAPKAAGNSSKVGVLYKHGVEIVLRGRYLDLMAYLQMLEDAYPKLLWSEAALAADTYPLNTLRVAVFMLSTHSNP